MNFCLLHIIYYTNMNMTFSFLLVLLSIFHKSIIDRRQLPDSSSCACHQLHRRFPQNWVLGNQEPLQRVRDRLRPPQQSPSFRSQRETRSHVLRLVQRDNRLSGRRSNVSFNQVSIDLRRSPILRGRPPPPKHTAQSTSV